MAQSAGMWTSDQARYYVRDTLAAHGYELADLSRRIGHKDQYLNQYIKQRTPDWLKQEEREALCREVSELDEEKLKRPLVNTSSATKPPRRKGGKETQVNPKPLGEFVNDPRILELIATYRAIRNEDDRALGLRMLRRLADASAIVA